jgi:hypothetical protein
VLSYENSACALHHSSRERDRLLHELAFGLCSEDVQANQLSRLLARSSVTTNHLHDAYSLIFEGDYVVTVPPDVGRRRIWA